MTTSDRLPNSLGEEPLTEEEKSSRSARANILFAFAVAVGLWTAYQVRDLLLLVFVSALFAVVLTPLVNGITKTHVGKWRPGRGVAIFVLVVAVVGATVLFFVFAIPPVISDTREFMKDLPKRGSQLINRLHALPLISDLNLTALLGKVQGFASNFAEYVFLSITVWAGKLADILATVVLTIYFMMEGDRAYRWMLSFFPRQMRVRLDNTLMRAEVRMSKWLIGQGLLMLILWIASTITFVCLKIRYAYALGILMGALNLVPVAGAMASMALVLLVAAIDSWGKVLGAIIFYAIYAQVETSYLTPRIMRTSVDLAGLAVLIALLLGTRVAGIVGAMVAVPTAVLVAVLIQEYLVKDDASVLVVKEMP